METGHWLLATVYCSLLTAPCSPLPWQLYGKRRALVQLAFDANLSAMGLDDLSRNGKSESAAYFGALSAPEALKDVG